MVDLNKAGITQVPTGYEQGINLYQTASPVQQELSPELLDSMKESFAVISKLAQEPSMDLGLTMNNNRTPIGLSNSFTVEKALKEMQTNDRFVTYDIETLGTFDRMKTGKEAHADFAEVTEISMQISGLKDGRIVDSQDPITLTVGLSDSGKERIRLLLDQLEQNGRSYRSMTERERATIADLTLYDNSASFGETVIAGQPFKILTGQASKKPNHNAPAIGSRETLRRAREGFANLTNPEKTNTADAIAIAMNTIITPKTTMGGHNTENFDQNNLGEYLGRNAKNAPKELFGKLKKPGLDSLILARSRYPQGAEDLPNFRLSTVYGHLFGQESATGQLHFSGEDTRINTKVIAKLVDDWQADSQKNGLDGKRAFSVNNNQIFMAKKGTQNYYASSYTKDAGRYDMTIRRDEKGNIIQNRTFQEGGVVYGDHYVLKGQYSDIKMGGTTMNALVLQDMKSQTEKWIFRENESELSAYLDNHLTPVRKAPNAKRESVHTFAKEDAARRFYEDIFGSRMKYFGSTSAKEWQAAKRNLGIYQKERDALVAQGATETEARTQAIHRTHQILNKGKDPLDQYSFGIEKIERMAWAEGRIAEEAPFWDNIIARAEQIYPAGSGVKGDQLIHNQKRQNLFIQNIFDQVNSMDTETQEYGYKGMRRLPVVSPKGKIVHTNVESKEAIQSTLGSTLRKKSSPPSAILNDFNQLISQMQGDLSSVDLFAMKKEIEAELANGGIRPGTLERISNRIYIANQNNPNVKKKVAGMRIRKASSDGTSGVAAYLSQLKSNESEFFKNIIEKAKEETDMRINPRNGLGPAGELNISALSSAAASRTKTSHEIVSFFDEQILGTQDLLKLNQSGRVKVNHVDVNKAVSGLVKSFEDQNFKTSLEYFGERGEMYLFFTDDSRSLDLADLSPTEKLFNPNVGHLTVPLYKTDGTISINGTSVTNRTKVRLDSRNGKYPQAILENTQDLAFREYQGVAKGIRTRELTEKLEKRGLSTTDIYRAEIAARSNRMTKGTVAKSYQKNYDHKDDWGKSSTNKNFATGTTIDIADYSDYVLHRLDKKEYERFRAFQLKHGEDTDFLNSEYKPRNRSIKNKVILSLDSDFNDVFAAHGLRVSFQGTKEKQMSKGIAYAKDSRAYTPGGAMSPVGRENITKTENTINLQQHPIKEYFRKQGMSEAEIEERVHARYTETGLMRKELFGEDTISSVAVRGMFMDDVSLKKKMQAGSKEASRRIDELTGQLVRVTNPDDRAKIENVIENLREAKARLDSNKATNYEGQMLVQQELLSSMEVVREMNVKLDQNYSLNKKLQESISQRTGLDISGNQEFLAMPQGEVLFEKPIGMAEMKKMRLIDKNGQLTVGNLMRDTLIDGGDKEVLAARKSVAQQKYQLAKEAEIFGIQHTEDGISLMIRQKNQLKNGSKILETVLGSRATAVGISELELDLMGAKGVQVIAEQISPSRNQLGAMVALPIQTGAVNIVENMRAAAKDNQFSKLYAPVQEWARKNKFTVQDLNRVEIQQQALNEVLRPALKPAGMDGALGVAKDKPVISLKEGFHPDALIGNQAGANIGQLYKNLANFGVEENNWIMNIGAHDVVEWQGGAVRNKFGRRELSIMKNDGDRDPRLLQGYEKLQGTSPLAQEHRAHGKRVAKALEMRNLDESAESINKVFAKGNIIFDMTGAVAANEKSNFRIENGTYIVDATNLGLIPEGSKRAMMDIKGTMADPLSVRLFDKDSGFDKTLGEMLQENQKATPFLQLQNLGDYHFANTFVPISGSVSASGKDLLENYHSNESASAFESIYNNAYLHNKPLSVSDLVDAESKEMAETLSQRYRTNANKSISNYYGEMSRYMTSQKQSGYLQASNSVHSEYGFSAKIGSFDPLSQSGVDLDAMRLGKNGLEFGDPTKGEYAVGEFVVNRKSASVSIDGIERNILKANDISDKTIAQSLGKRRITDKDRHNFILDELSNPESKLSIFGDYNRNPTQSTGSLRIGKLRVDPTMSDDENRILVDLGTQLLSKADGDGDTAFVALDLYSAYTSKDDLRSLQSALASTHQKHSAKAEKLAIGVSQDVVQNIFDKEKTSILSGLRQDWAKKEGQKIDASIGTEDWLSGLPGSQRQEYLKVAEEQAFGRMKEGALSGQGIYHAIEGMNQREIQSLFRKRIDSEEEDYITKAILIQQGQAIGRNDNMLVAGRDLLSYTSRAALDAGSINQNQYRDILDNYDVFGDKLVQNFISAKKVTAEKIGYEADATREENIHSALSYIDENLGLSGKLKNINEENVPSVMDTLINNKIVSTDNAEDMAGYNTLLTNLARANRATSDFGGMRSLSLSPRSAGQTDGRFVDTLREHPETMMGTDLVMQALDMFPAQQRDQTKALLTQNNTRVGELFGQIYNEKVGQSTSELLDSAQTQLAELAQYQYEQKAERASRTSRVTDMLSSVGSTLKDSAATKIGMGIGAAWMLGSAIRREPTPEGNEAQQEATPVEVNPAALLTSPTARVTPRGENVRLQVSGKGNLDQNTIAGIVNEQLANMTGIPMNMQVNVSDNTQQLDKSFYEQTLNRILGF